MINFPIGLCPTCSDKLNYHSKKREAKRMKKHTKHASQRYDAGAGPSSVLQATTSHDSTVRENEMTTSQNIDSLPNRTNDVAHQQLEQIFWSKSTDDVEKSREEEFDDYLADLLL